MKGEGSLRNTSGSKPLGRSRLSLTGLTRRMKAVVSWPAESLISSW